MHQSRQTALAAAVATLVLAGAVFLGPAATTAQNEPATPAAPATPAMTAEAAGPEIVIHPSGGVDGDYFTLEAEPGSQHGLDIILGNADDEPMTLRTFANDAVPITNGGFAMADEEVPPAGPATWLDYQAETFDFAPGEGVTRRFTVSVPEDAAPGQYIAGIALQTAEPMPVEGSDMFNQIIRKAVAVFIIVPGPEQPAFSLGKPEVVTSASGRQRIDIPVLNTGNVLIKPQGEVRLENAEGETAISVPVTMGSVYAGTTVPLSVTLPSGFPEGEYTVQLVLADPGTGATADLQPTTLRFAPVAQSEQAIALSGEATALPDIAAPAFIEVSLSIENAGDPVPQAAVVLEVARDGVVVETYTLASSLALPTGITELTQRYVPASGLEPGNWTFTVRVQVVDPSTGAQTTVATMETLPPIDIGE